MLGVSNVAMIEREIGEMVAETSNSQRVHAFWKFRIMKLCIER